MRLFVRSDILLRNNGYGSNTGIRVNVNYRGLHKYTKVPCPRSAHSARSSNLSILRSDVSRQPQSSAKLLVKHLRARLMSTEPTKHKFFVYAPDFTDEGCMQRRLAVRVQHLEGAKKLAEQGILRA